jgi:hypothetical protein
MTATQIAQIGTRARLPVSPASAAPNAAMRASTV